jgi:hypothetical protein
MSTKSAKRMAAKQERRAPAEQKRRAPINGGGPQGPGGKYWTQRIEPKGAALLSETLRPCHLVVKNMGLTISCWSRSTVISWISHPALCAPPTPAGRSGLRTTARNRS